MEAGESICGVWIDRNCQAHLALRDAAGNASERAEAFRPFYWGQAEHGEACELQGDLSLHFLNRFAANAHYRAALKKDSKEGYETLQLRPLESQFLLDRQLRMLAHTSFEQLRRVQLTFQAASADGHPDPDVPGDRVLAIGGSRILESGTEARVFLLAEDSDGAEKALLEAFAVWLRESDPDIVEGHHLFKGSLDYLRKRCKLLKIKPFWGRFEQNATARSSRLRVAERWIDYPRCEIPGRTCFDTFLMIQLYDIALRELPGYDLDAVCEYLELERAEIPPCPRGGEKSEWENDHARLEARLHDRMRVGAAVSEILLPTYVAQAKAFPMTLQEITLRGTGGKVDVLFFEKYYHAEHSLPLPPEVETYPGGYTKSFGEGVYRKVLHFDVASLYPSLLLSIGRNPENDALGVFIPLLKNLREERLRYKKLARESEDPALRREYSARQQSFKILINSFYGYLGFPGAVFADGALAAEVTERGRELLQKLITRFEELGAQPLEADTDGIYVVGEDYWEDPERLLELAKSAMPEGIDLEYDGAFEAMFCYKAKNYALYDGESVRIRGSALRSRGIEPFLKRLSDALIHYLLGASELSPLDLAEQFREQITQREMPVRELAKSEFLSQNPRSYEKAVSGGGKPRRASLEVALTLEPRPRTGDQVTYYLKEMAKKAPDWQRARALEHYDAEDAPYDPQAYLKKLDDWLKRYRNFVEEKSVAEQGELL